MAAECYGMEKHRAFQRDGSKVMLSKKPFLLLDRTFQSVLSCLFTSSKIPYHPAPCQLLSTTLIAGCPHTGIISTIKYGQKITGLEHDHAVIGIGICLSLLHQIRTI